MSFAARASNIFIESEMLFTEIWKKVELDFIKIIWYYTFRKVTIVGLTSVGLIVALLINLNSLEKTGAVLNLEKIQTEI